MRFEFLSKYFPLPQFLAPRHIGVSFSDLSIKAISFDRTLSKPELKKAIIPLEKGTIIDGKIVNTREVAAKLSEIKEFFNSPFIFFTVPDELTFVFQVLIPIGRGGNAIESVAFSIEENVPLALADTVFDFTPIKIAQSEAEYQASVVVAACVKKEVEKFVNAIHESGLELVGCIHESQAIANAVILKKSSGTSCIVHARKDRVGIYLVKDNTVHFSTLRSILEGDYKNQFLDEYEKFLEYSLKYNTGDGQDVKTIFVCGEFEYAQKIIEAIAGSDNPVKNAKLSNIWANVLKIEENTPSISYEDSLNLAGPAGAVLSAII